TSALLGNGSVRCWGINNSGQLGDGSHTAQFTPAAASVPNAIAIAAVDSHSCALLIDAPVRCWGNDADGEAGDGGSGVGNLRLLPVAVSRLFGVVALGAGQGHTCALLS